MPAGLAARIVTEYSAAGHLVVDPSSGDSAIVVEAARAGRRAVGVASRPRQGSFARTCLDSMLDPSQRRLVEVVVGSAVRLPELLGSRTGTVDLVVLGGAGCRVREAEARTVIAAEQQRASNNDDEKPSRGRSGRRTGGDLASGGALYAASLALLRPGGLLVTVPALPYARGGYVDGAATSVELAQQAGFGYLQHVIALRAQIRDGGFYPQPSPQQLSELKGARDRGKPAHLLVHTDVFVFSKPAVSR